MASALLLENGSYLLLEDGSSHLLLEAASAIPAHIIQVSQAVMGGTY